MGAKTALIVLAVLVVGFIAFGAIYAFNRPSSAYGTAPNYTYPAPVIEYRTTSPAPQPVLIVSPPKTPEPVFCTMDAKLCPDGSYVGRVPPSCQFATCPRSY